MFKSLSLLIFLFFSTASFGQKQKEPRPPKMWSKHMEAKDYKNRECSHQTRYSPEQRLKFYPFTEAALVRVVSFDNKPDSAGYILIGSNSLPMLADTVDYTKLDEIKTLNYLQIDTLTDILYNTDYKRITNLRGRVGVVSQSCYNPRNAVLFVDSSGKTFAFIELCFECGGHRESSELIQAGEFCRGKYELLQNYFKSSGIEIGTIRGAGFKLVEP